MNCVLNQRRHSRAAFTLVELLVVIAIIALLLSVMMPALAKVMEQSRTLVCKSKLSQMHLAVLTYADFVAPAPSGTIWGGRDAIALIEGGGRSAWKNKRVQVAGQAITPKNLAAVSPAWSPKGTHVAFAAMPDWTGPGTAEPVQSESMQRRIWVTNVVGEPQSRQLTDTAGYRDERPSWSADGNYILFVRMDTKGRASLWIVSLDHGALRQVVDELTPAPDPLGFYGHVDWDVLFDWWRGATA